MRAIKVVAGTAIDYDDVAAETADPVKSIVALAAEDRSFEDSIAAVEVIIPASTEGAKPDRRGEEGKLVVSGIAGNTDVAAATQVENIRIVATGRFKIIAVQIEAVVAALAIHRACSASEERQIISVAHPRCCERSAVNCKAVVAAQKV